jgi:antitoxin component of RelBE/YafQ-DinJ toxin-antitoxin module
VNDALLSAVALRLGLTYSTAIRSMMTCMASVPFGISIKQELLGAPVGCIAINNK